MKFLNTAKAAARAFNEDAIIEYDVPPVEEDTAIIELPEGWVHIGERNGKPHYRTAPGVAVPKPKRVNKVREALKRLGKLDRHTFNEGSVCPACNGKGYIPQFGHVAGGICFKCNDPRSKGLGKGWISAQDKHYNDARIKAGTLCDVKAA